MVEINNLIRKKQRLVAVKVSKGGVENMAQTDAGKKKVYVEGHTKEDGTKVRTHYRSTPNTSNGKKKK